MAPQLWTRWRARRVQEIKQELRLEQYAVFKKRTKDGTRWFKPGTAEKVTARNEGHVIIKGSRGRTHKVHASTVDVFPCQGWICDDMPDNEAAVNELRSLLEGSSASRATTAQARALKERIDSGQPWLPACLVGPPITDAAKFTAAQPLKHGIRFQLAIVASKIYEYFGSFGLDAAINAFGNAAEPHQLKVDLDRRMNEIRVEALRIATGTQKRSCRDCGIGNAIDGVAIACCRGLSTIECILDSFKPKKPTEEPAEEQVVLPQFCSQPPSAVLRLAKRRATSDSELTGKRPKLDFGSARTRLNSESGLASVFAAGCVVSEPLKRRRRRKASVV